MDLALTSDQAVILDAVDSLAKPYAAPPVDCRSFVLASPDLDREIRDNGFLDVGFDPDLGMITAALVVEKFARLPYATEAAASALVRPLIGDLAGPVCLVDAARIAAPVRFLAEGATVVMLHADKVTTFTATESDIVPVTDSILAYPVALLNPDSDFASRAEVADVSADAVRSAWSLAIAVEMAGLLGAALDSTVLHVSERKQFGRPIGVFQAVRHRLAEVSVRAMGTRWLALKAAHSGDAGDAALAAHYAQESATQAVYDFHQFLGAMGMTLEHPLHLWTYRMKSLLGDLGGRDAQATAAADLIWPDAA